jgi:hypothetical protein
MPLPRAPMSSTLSNASPRAGLQALAIITVLSVLLSSATLLNPGYFSHDELGYLRQDIQLHAIQGESDSHGFLRPLGAWLIWLAVNAAPSPQLAHAVSVVAHALNALLLRRCLISAGHRHPLAASVLFVVSPLAAYSVGWTSALFDIGWVGMGLMIWWVMLQSHDRVGKLWQVALASTLYVAALLFKETAVTIPLMLATWVVSQPRAKRRPHFAALATLIAITVVYLGLRLLSLHGLAEGGAGGYGRASIQDLGHHLITYWVYPLAVTTSEVQQVGAFFKTRDLIALALAHLSLVYMATGWRLRRLLAYVLLYFLPLLPVLLIHKHETQYLYASAVTTSVLLTLWADTLGVKLLLAAIAAGAAVHTVSVHRFFQLDGRCQSSFLKDLGTINWQAHQGETVHFQVAREGRWWVIYRTLVHAPILIENDISAIPADAANTPDGVRVVVTPECHIGKAPH